MTTPRNTSRHIALAALLATTAACADQQPLGLDLEKGSPSFSAVRSMPTDLSGINTHYGSEAELLYAVGNTGIGSSNLFSSLSHSGGHLQVGLRETVEAGFPSNGSQYLIVTSGDSRDIMAQSGYYNSCNAVEAGLCDVGTAYVPVVIPADAKTLEFDMRYFSHDDAYWADPFRVYLTVDGVTTKVSELTTTGEFAGMFKAAGAFAWSPKQHHLAIDVSAHAGKTVTLSFQASDADDGFGGAFDSGAAIDNIRVARNEIQAPVVDSLIATPNPVAVNTQVSISAIVDDQATGASTIAGAEFSLDGGVTWTRMGAADGNFNTDREKVTGAFTSPAGATVVTLQVRGRDANNIASAVRTLEIAVYDPTAGYIAGSGSIDSPMGAYVADATLAGTASFGFSSKYKAGANTPDGSTRFTFRAAGFKFQSTVYEWLVISGTRGQFKGSGTIDGQGDYGFKLTGIDGDGKLTFDSFRIKIWDKATGATVYDNEIAQPEDADPSTMLRSGNVMIKR